MNRREFLGFAGATALSFIGSAENGEALDWLDNEIIKKSFPNQGEQPGVCLANTLYIAERKNINLGLIVPEDAFEYEYQRSIGSCASWMTRALMEDFERYPEEDNNRPMETALKLLGKAEEMVHPHPYWPSLVGLKKYLVRSGDENCVAIPDGFKEYIGSRIESYEVPLRPFPTPKELERLRVEEPERLAPEYRNFGRVILPPTASMPKE